MKCNCGECACGSCSCLSTEWISVDFGLPNQYDRVLVSDRKSVSVCYFQDDSFVGNELDMKITHWMPFPAKPV